MPAVPQGEPCTLHILNQPSADLHQFQLELECQDTGSIFTYRIEVEKLGKSGTSKTSQSGRITIDSKRLVVGNVKINVTPTDTVRVNASLSNSENVVVSQVNREYPPTR